MAADPKHLTVIKGSPKIARTDSRDSISDIEIKTKSDHISKSIKEYAVLCIETQFRHYSIEEPYMTPRICESIGSGFILKTVLPGSDEPKLFFVTNAHVVSESNSIQVRYANTSKTYMAKPVYINHECDLALLDVKDESFWQQRKPLTLRDGFDVSDIQEDSHIYLIGFPSGGAECSMTKGIISRIEMQSYAHSGLLLPAIQVDASLNPGNSGGPAIFEDAVMGVSVQKDSSLESMNIIIPVTVLKNFLRQSQLKEESFRGFPFPDFFIYNQRLENKFLRKSLHLEDDQTGVLITQDSVMCDLKKNDILTHIDNYPIDNTGKITFRGILFEFYVIVSEKILGDKLQLSIIRNKEKLKVDCVPTKTKQYLYRCILGHAAKIPSFYVGSGIVFQTVTQLHNAQSSYKPRTESQEELIFIAKILKDEMTVGYDSYKHHFIKFVNEKKPKNIQHLIELFENNPDEYHTIGVYSSWHRDLYTIVLPNLEKDLKSKMEFLNRCGVYIERSENLCSKPKDLLLHFSSSKVQKEDEKGASSKLQLL